MKSYKNLFTSIIAFENFLIAAHKAAKGKREKRNVMNFFEELEHNILELSAELKAQTYRPGGYATFQIYDPKPRMISAAPFRDRVVHHALMNVVGPLLERSFIFDVYSNRVGKGTHRAVKRYQFFSRKFKYALKCDIRKYFPSIDHLILKKLITKRIGCAKTRWLLELIIDESNEQEQVVDFFSGDSLFTPLQRRKGLPIGNLTSQFLANVYLQDLDYFVKQKLRCKGYLRYVDDFVLFSNSKETLWQMKNRICNFLTTYRLKLNLKRCAVYPTEVGRPFLGFVVYSGYCLLPGKNVRKIRKRLNFWITTGAGNLEQRIAGWLGHALNANSFGLIRSLGLEKSINNDLMNKHSCSR